MSFTSKKETTATEKNFLAVIEPAIIVDSWTLSAGNVYYNDFTVSTEFLEYVTKVTKDGAALTGVTSTPSTDEFYWDWDNKRLYINVGGDPSSYTMVVFYEIHVATKSIHTNRDPNDTSSQVVYYQPRIESASIPQIDQTELLLYGLNSGSISLINTDGAFYIYSGFRNKNIKIYHVLDDVSNFKLIYRGKIEDFDIDDSVLSLKYRTIDYIFNNKFNSYLATGADTTKGYFNLTYFPNLSPDFSDYAVRAVFGVADDILPVNIDYDATASTTNNRDFIVRSDGTNAHQLSQAASNGSTTTRIEFGTTHYFQVGDAILCELASDEYTWVTVRGADYIEVSPAITAPTSGQLIKRSTIGYIKIKDFDGNVFNLAYNRDFTESTFANNTLGFVLADNFEANHAGLTIFDPASYTIYCRCYGKKHSTINDSQYGNLTAANLILDDILQNYVKFTTIDADFTTIQGLSTQALGFSIPEDLSPTNPTYRDIIKKINDSILGQTFLDTDSKLSYRLIGPMGSSTYTVDDSKIMLNSFKSSFDARDLYNKIIVLYARKESANGSGIASNQRQSDNSTLATYLHETENDLSVETYLLKQSEAATIASRYVILYEDWQRFVEIRTKTQLSENVISDIITVEREKLNGYNYEKGTKRSTKYIISKIKKGLGGVEVGLNDQYNIEDKSGSW